MLNIGDLEKGMATHSSILPWRIPWAEESGGLWSIGSDRAEAGLSTYLPPRPNGSWSHWRSNSLQQSAPDTDLFQPLRGPSRGEPLPRVLPFGAGQQAPGMEGGASTGRGMRTRGDGSHSSRGGGRRRRKRRRWTRRRRRRRRLLWQLRRMLRRGAGLGARGVGSRAPHGLGMRARLGV